MANKDIRDMAKLYHVKLWQIADILGLADTTFSKRLRKELSREEKNKIISIIKSFNDEF